MRVLIGNSRRSKNFKPLLVPIVLAISTLSLFSHNAEAGKNKDLEKTNSQQSDHKAKKSRFEQDIEMADQAVPPAAAAPAAAQAILNHNPWLMMESNLANKIRPYLSKEDKFRLRKVSKKGFLKGNEYADKKVIINHRTFPEMAEKNTPDFLKEMRLRFSTIPAGTVSELQIQNTIRTSLGRLYDSCQREKAFETLPYSAVLEEAVKTFPNLRSLILSELEIPESDYWTDKHLHFLMGNHQAREIWKKDLTKVLFLLNQLSLKSVPLEVLDVSGLKEYRISHAISLFPILAKFENLQSLTFVFPQGITWEQVPLLPLSLRNLSILLNNPSYSGHKNTLAHVPDQLLIYIARHKNLQHLELHGFSLSFLQLKQLEDFKIKELVIDHISTSEEIEFNSGIQELALNRTDHINGEDLARLLRSPSLRKLSLSEYFTPMERRGSPIQWLEGMQNNNLVELRLTGITLPKVEVPRGTFPPHAALSSREILTRLPSGFPNLEVLELGFSKAAKLVFADSAFKDSKLRKLIISGEVENIGDVLIQALNFNNLEHIDLSSIGGGRTNYVKEFRKFFEYVSENNKPLIKLTLPTYYSFLGPQIEEMKKAFPSKIEVFYK